MRPVNRFTPKLPLQVMETFAIDAPAATHFRQGTCREVDCEQYIHGWKTAVDEATELGQRQAHYIRKESGRSFVEHREVDGLTTFVFDAGQTCFRTHQVRIDRPEIFTLRGGDWRGTTTEPRRLPAHGWVDEMQENFERLRQKVR